MPEPDDLDDIPDLAPVGGGQPVSHNTSPGTYAAVPPIVPPQPVLLGGGPAAATAQPWAIARKVFPLKVSQGRAIEKSQVSEYRTGDLMVDANGITLQGKAVLAGPLRTTIFVVLVVVLKFGGLLAAVVLEYLIRVSRADSIPWSDIETIVLEPEKQRACIAYRLSKNPKIVYSLGLTLEGGLFNEFANTFRERLPGKVNQGKILPATPTWVWILFGVIIVAIIVGLVITSSRH